MPPHGRRAAAAQLLDGLDINGDRLLPPRPSPKSGNMLSPARRSTTEIGLAFEKHSQRYLNNHLQMSLRRVGRAGDGGVDLRGSWFVPRDAVSAVVVRQQQKLAKDLEAGGMQAGRETWRRLSVVGQCKAEKKPLGPRAVRELEGVVAHLQGSRRKGKQRSISPDQSPPSTIPDQLLAGESSQDEESSQDIIAILSSQSGFSKQAMLHATKSQTPLLLLHLPGGQAVFAAEKGDCKLPDPARMEVEGLWWNSALSGPAGVLGGKMELRREILAEGGTDQVTGDTLTKVRYRLYHNGKHFTRLGPDLGMHEENI